MLTLKGSLRGWLILGKSWCWIMDSIHPSVRALLGEIERALDAKLYYSAIAVALSVPDVCASLELDPAVPSWSTKDKYEAWFASNLGSIFKNLTASDCYRLRGGVLHQGHFRHPKARYDRIIFLLPDSPFRAHDVVVSIAKDVVIGGLTRAEITGRDQTGDVLYLEAVRFCKQIIEAARLWAIAKKDDANVQANLPNLVRLRPEGLPPFIVGVPLIA
jgi:hypothetical protein